MGKPVVVVRHAYSFPEDPGTSYVDSPSLTKISEQDDADINVILSRFGETGLLRVSGIEPRYLDVSQLGSYQEVLDHAQFAKDVFGELPQKAKDRFKSVDDFLAALQDPARVEELQGLGVLEAEARAAAGAAAVEEPASPAEALEGVAAPAS